MQVELRNISKRFGTVQANEDVSLTVEAGSVHGLLGENGAGKSTLVKILSGFLSCDRGTIWLDGKAVTFASPAAAIRLGIGMLHQDPQDFPALTVLENFMVGQPGGLFIHPRRMAKRFYALAQAFGFALNWQDRVGTLTVGERQQLEILRLLSLGINTLVLDEPTTGISATQQETLFAAVKKLATQGKSIIFVSHKLEDVNALCDRISVMRQGKVVGHLPIPSDENRVIELMFGQTLAPPVKLATRQPDIALQLTDIRLSTPRLNLQIASLTIYRGEVIGLAGLEGNGQQPFLQLCAGLLPVEQGRLALLGQDLTGASYRDFRTAGIGYSPADRLREGLISGLTLQEHVALGRGGRLLQWRQIVAQTRRAISTYNIQGKPQTQVEQLSGGNQQRAQLALLPTPLNLLLMEHPTRGLDIESTLWVWQQLIARCQGGTTIVFMSADLDEIMQYSDRVIVFSGGQLSEPMATQHLTVHQLGRRIGGRLEPSLDR